MSIDPGDTASPRHRLPSVRTGDGIAGGWEEGEGRADKSRNNPRRSQVDFLSRRSHIVAVVLAGRSRPRARPSRPRRGASMPAVAEESTLVHRAELCAPRGSDAGQCVARLPRVFRIPAGAPVLVARGSRTALCVALPLDAPPVRRKDVRDASCADGLPDGTSKTRIRVDRTLSFIASTSGCGADGTGPAGDALTVSRVLSALDRPRRQKSGTGWPPAEEVVVHVLAAAAATGLTAGAVVARAKTALRCVGCVPPPEAGGGASLCVFGADGVTAVARVSTFPPAPVVIALGTRFAVAPCAEDSAGDDSGPLRAQQETSHAYAAVRSLLGQDVLSHWALGSSPMTGLLLSGPPGIGKTSGVLAAAQDCGFAVACVRRGRDRSHGAPARALRAAFSEARNSLASGTRAIVFLDEIDARSAPAGRAAPAAPRKIAPSHSCSRSWTGASGEGAAAPSRSSTL
jgi:ATPase family associated with various cellular activities (AAA)